MSFHPAGRLLTDADGRRRADDHDVPDVRGRAEEAVELYTSVFDNSRILSNYYGAAAREPGN
jgi:hypothetical protein